MRQERELADRLAETGWLEREEWARLIRGRDEELAEYVFARARQLRCRYYGQEVYIRGLIEFTNFCRNDCYYCGIRKSNSKVRRYRLTGEEILQCCRNGYALGFRTFVLQGGEDGFFTDAVMEEIVREIRKQFPDCAITLSLGERSRESYQRLFDAGADRYLLRHETYDRAHYERLHPPFQRWETRQRCLRDLKEIGYQVGAGFMVGSPFQTVENLADDLCFLKELNPQMVGIGPFIPHRDTPFAGKEAGSLELTLFLLGLIRLMLPKVLLPATTALGTIADDGRERGILAGANVVMPNLSPEAVRGDYLLYDNKRRTGDEAAEGLAELDRRMRAIGYRIAADRGDSKNI